MNYGCAYGESASANDRDHDHDCDFYRAHVDSTIGVYELASASQSGREWA